MLETASRDLDEARGKIEATRADLVAVLNAQERPDAELAALVARLDRVLAGLEPIERLVESKRVGDVAQVWAG